jgi:hypothetical protein
MREAGRRQVMIGLAIAGVGLALSLGSYEMASSNGGGGYFVLWGAVIFGLIRAGRGYSMMRSAPAPRTSSPIARSMHTPAAPPPAPAAGASPAQAGPQEPTTTTHLPPPPKSSMWD